MTNFKIEKGVPIPSAQGANGTRKYPFEDLEVGDSFEAPEVARKSTYMYEKSTGFKFTCRAVSETTVRIWRIK